MPGYRKVAIDDLPNTPNPTREKKEVDEAVGTTEFGFNVFRAEPGEQIPWGYHQHPDHEELFYVVAGELVVETPDENYHVGAGEAFFVPPDHWNRARAVGEEVTEVIAVGAPKDSDGAVIEEACPACGEVTGRASEMRETDETVEYVLTCDACGAETSRFD